MANQKKKQILTENLPGGLSHDEFRNQGANLPVNKPTTPSNLPQQKEEDDEEKDKP